MKETIRRLMFIHLAVFSLVAVGAFLVWGPSVGVSSAVGVLAFSIPVVAFSLMVLRASQGGSGRFWGRFMVAELLKWVSSGVLLALAFLSGLFLAQPLLAGFLLSVIVQVFFPIFVRKESES